MKSRIAAAGLSDRTIVLTGAMVPFAFGSSDGLFNLGSALSFAQVRAELLAVVMRNHPEFSLEQAQEMLREAGF